MRIYYAHCQAIYGTPQEARDLELLDQSFVLDDSGGGPYDVVNPNDPAINARCAEIRATFGPNTTDNPVPGQPGLYYTEASGKIMHEVFEPLVASCDVLVFRALPDGSVPAGVLQEIRWAEERKIPVLEIPSWHLRRVLTVEETRTYLKEIGQR